MTETKQVPVEPGLLKELSATLNRNSAEYGSDTPDFILATFLTDCLNAWDKAVSAREAWYGRVTTEAAAPATEPEFGFEDIPACQYCGAMAGACSDYPNCPNGPTLTPTTEPYSEATIAAMQSYADIKAARPEPSEVERLAVEIADSASKQIINQWVYGSGPGKGYIDRHGIGPDWLQKCIDYADLRGLLEYHPDHPELVRVKGEKS